MIGPRNFLNLFKQLHKYLNSFLWLLLLLMIFVNSLPALYIWLEKNVIDQISLMVNTNSANIILARKIFLAYLCIRLLYEILNYIYNLLKENTKEKLSNALNKEYLVKMKLIDFEHLENPITFNLINRSKEASDLILDTTLGFFDLLSAVISIGTMSAIFLSINKYVVPLLIAGVVPYYFLVKKYGVTEYMQKVQQYKEQRMSSYLYGLINNRIAIKEIHTFKTGDYLIDKWNQINNKLWHQKRELSKKYLLYQIRLHLLRYILFIFALLLIIRDIYLGKTMIGSLVILIQTITGVQGNILGILKKANTLSVNYERIKEWYTMKTLSEEKSNIESFNLLSTKPPVIEFQNVSFTYPGKDKYAIKNLTLKIKPGEKIALVGPNGSGKSTFIALLMGFYTPQLGKILFDRKDITTSKEEIRDLISCVFQHPINYQLQIKEVIALGDVKQEFNIEKVKERAQNTQIHNFIKMLPEEYETPLGQLEKDGYDFSGGQWQRIAIARCLYKEKAQILILDEPTAALDPISESNIYEKFASYTGKKTTLLISHRLGITSLVDRILVFKEGEIVEDGTHETLLKQKGLYADMYLKQIKWYAI